MSIKPPALEVWDESLKGLVHYGGRAKILAPIKSFHPFFCVPLSRCEIWEVRSEILSLLDMDFIAQYGFSSILEIRSSFFLDYDFNRRNKGSPFLTRYLGLKVCFTAEPNNNRTSPHLNFKLAAKTSISADSSLKVSVTKVIVLNTKSEPCERT